MKAGDQNSPFFGRLGPTPFLPIGPASTAGNQSPRPTQALLFDLVEALELPSTPTRKTSDYFTPPRPCKPTPKFDSFPLRSPGSPKSMSLRTPSPPNRSSTSPLGNRCASGGPGSPNKRRRLEDKENLSPQPQFSIALVAERPATKVPPSILGKRSVMDEDNAKFASKKHKMNSAVPANTFLNGNGLEPTDDSTFVHAVTEPPLHSAQPTDPEQHVFTAKARGITSHNEIDPSLTRSSKKRRGIFMESVEIPTLRQIRRRQRRTVSLESTTLATPPSPGLRRTRSAMKPPNDIKTFNALTSEQAGKQRRHRGDSQEAKQVDDPFDSKLLLREDHVLGSGQHNLVFELV
jgi:hypothetical protein